MGSVPDLDDEWSSGQCFLPVELWERAGARLQAVRSTGQRLDRVLSGLLFCAECGGWSPMSLCYSRHKTKDGPPKTRDRYRCIHRVRDPESCRGHSIAADEVEEFLLAQLQAALGTDELAEARFRRRTRAAAEQLAGGADQCEAELTGLRDKQRELFDRREGGEIIPDHIYNEEMGRLESACRRREARRDEAVGAVTLTKAALKKLRAELATGGPLNRERWYTLPAAQRNEFLRLLFPDGILVEWASRHNRRPASERLRVRAAKDVERSSKLRFEPASVRTPTMRELRDKLHG